MQYGKVYQTAVRWVESAKSSQKKSNKQHTSTRMTSLNSLYSTACRMASTATLPTSRLNKSLWVGWDSNPEPTPKRALFSFYNMLVLSSLGLSCFLLLHLLLSRSLSVQECLILRIILGEKTFSPSSPKAVSRSSFA
jgi:hypothetical protein